MEDKRKNGSAKERLALAMKECMRTTSVEAITVRQLCEVSNLSRQTFYRQFLDKYDLINWYFDRLLHESFKQMGNTETIYEGLVRKFDFIRSEQVFFSSAFRSDTQNNLKQHDFDAIFAFYKNLIIEKSGSSPDREITDLLEMYCQASIYMTVKWTQEDMKQSSTDLAQLMIAALPPKLEALFRELNVLR